MADDVVGCLDDVSDIGSPASVMDDVCSSPRLCMPRGKRPRLSIESFFSEQTSQATSSLDACAASARELSQPLLLPVESDGINIDHLFSATADLRPTDHNNTCRRLFDLPVVDAAEILVWHPNRVFVTVLEYVLPRLPLSVRPRRLNVKQFQGAAFVAAPTQDALCDLKVRMTRDRRMTARDTFRRWLSRLARRPIRHIAAASHITWSMLSDDGKGRWFILNKIMAHDTMSDTLPEDMHGLRTGNDVGPTAGDVVPHVTAHKISGWGYLATYNTNIGLCDAMSTRWVQEGVRGEALKTKLISHPLYRACFDRFWEWHKDQAVKMGCGTYCASMEHSEHANSPARVHLHSYAGVQISGGVGCMKVPRLLNFNENDLIWEGCRPHVMPTMTRRKAEATVFNAVSTGVYYVVGEKSGTMFKEANAWPIQDKRDKCCCCQLVLVTSRAKPISIKTMCTAFHDLHHVYLR